MSKKYATFIVVLFCSFLGFFLAAGLLTPDRANSELENRALQQLPHISIGTLSFQDGAPHFSGNFFDGTFMTQFETYCNDQFFARDAWVGMKSKLELTVGKRENNGIYLARGDTLIPRFDQPDPQRLEANIGFLNAFISKSEVPVYTSLLPGQAAIWADRLPEGAPNADQKAVIDTVYAQLEGKTYDSYQALWDHRTEDIYYRTDHHWTSLGAYYGYTSLMAALGMEPIPLEDYQKTVATEEFYGTSFSTAGVRSVKPDTVFTYVPGDGLDVTLYPAGKPQAGSLYDASALERKDKYTYFMGGIQPLAVVKNPAVDGPKLLILRDSYADSMVPFLTRHFSEIHLFDPRYNKDSALQYIKDNDIDLVLVLYSVPNFSTDRSLFNLGKG